MRGFGQHMMRRRVGLIHEENRKAYLICISFSRYFFLLNKYFDVKVFECFVNCGLVLLMFYFKNEKPNTKEKNDIEK